MIAVLFLNRRAHTPSFFDISVINGETMTYSAPSFRDKLARTLGGQLQLLWNEHSAASKSIKKSSTLALKASMPSRSGSVNNLLQPENKTSAVSGGNSSGSALGLPGPLRNNRVLTATTVLADIGHEITSGDRFGDDYIVGTTDGLFLFDGASLVEIKTAKRRRYLKVVVAESRGIVVTLCGTRRFAIFWWFIFLGDCQRFPSSLSSPFHVLIAFSPLLLPSAPRRSSVHCRVRPRVRPRVPEAQL